MWSATLLGVTLAIIAIIVFALGGFYRSKYMFFLFLSCSVIVYMLSVQIFLEKVTVTQQLNTVLVAGFIYLLAKIFKQQDKYKEIDKKDVN